MERREGVGLSVLDEVLSRLEGVKESGDGFIARCPAHEDNNPSLCVSRGTDVEVVLNCFAGCSFDSIVGALGMSQQQFFESRITSPPTRPVLVPRDQSVTVANIAKAFRLPVEHLRSLGLKQSGSSVTVPYLDESGKEIYRRRRVAMSGKRKYLHPKGESLSLYGRDRLESYRSGSKPVVIVEGESDCWVLWKLGVWAVGVPGASACKVIEAGQLDGVPKVYVYQEPGEVGEQFQLKVGERLRDVGYQGKVQVISFRDHKDPADLWSRDPDKFENVFSLAVRRAVDWEPFSVEDMLIRMDTVERKQVEFLWDPYIPDSMVTLLAGKPGSGKSFLTCWLASRVSRGESFLGGQSVEPRNVLMFCKEDDPSLTLAARLEDNGADMSRVFVYDLQHHSFVFGDSSFSRLELLIDRLRPGLVSFDPIVSFTGRRVDLHKQSEVRGVLQPLIDIARRTSTPILLVGHSKKSSGGAAIDEIMGSVDFSAAPRSALLIYEDPASDKGEEAGVVVHAKHNNSRQGSSLRFAISENRWCWRGESRFSVSELQGGGADMERSRVDEAVDFLSALLTGEALKASEVQKLAKVEGINYQSLHRARLRLGVRSVRRGFGTKGSYWWSLDDQEVADREDVPL